MMLSLVVMAPALVVWLILPLLTLGAYRRAGLPPTAAATAALALVFAVGLILSGDALVARAVEERRAAFGMADVALYRAQAQYLVALGFAALGVASGAMIASGLTLGLARGGGSVLRAMAGLGAYGFHAGTGIMALLTLGPVSMMPRGHVPMPAAPAWQDQAGFIASIVMLASVGLVLLALAFAALRRAHRG